MSVALMGTVIASVLSCVGEMTALMPVNAPMMEFPRRFLDRGVGFAVGWVYWYVQCILRWRENRLLLGHIGASLLMEIPPVQVCVCRSCCRSTSRSFECGQGELGGENYNSHALTNG